MNKTDFISDFYRLCLVFDKKIEEELNAIYYDVVKEFSSEVFNKAITSMITECKFFPKPSEVLEYCSKNQNDMKQVIVEFMMKKRYFKSDSEIAKTLMFIKNKCVPSWLQRDMKYYYKLMINENLEQQGLPAKFNLNQIEMKNYE